MSVWMKNTSINYGNSYCLFVCSKLVVHRLFFFLFFRSLSISHSLQTIYLTLALFGKIVHLFDSHFVDTKKNPATFHWLNWLCKWLIKNWAACCSGVYECKNTISICVLHLWYDGNTISCTKTTCNNVLFLFFGCCSLCGHIICLICVIKLNSCCFSMWRFFRCRHRSAISIAVAILLCWCWYWCGGCCWCSLWKHQIIRASAIECLFAMLNWQFEWHHTNVKCSNHACGRLMCMW